MSGKVKGISKSPMYFVGMCPHCAYVSEYNVAGGNIVFCEGCEEPFYIEIYMQAQSRELTDEERKAWDSKNEDEDKDCSDSCAKE